MSTHTPCGSRMCTTFLSSLFSVGPLCTVMLPRQILCGVWLQCCCIRSTHPPFSLIPLPLLPFPIFPSPLPLISPPPWPRFFAGGSERSGQQIVGPPKKKSSNEVVEDLFKGAKEHGAVPVEKAGRGPGEPSRARVRLSLHTIQCHCWMKTQRCLVSSCLPACHPPACSSSFNAVPLSSFNAACLSLCLFLPLIPAVSFSVSFPLPLLSLSLSPLLVSISPHLLSCLPPPSVSPLQAFGGGGYRLGAAPEEQSAYVSGERRGANNQQDVSGSYFLLTFISDWLP